MPPLSAALSRLLCGRGQGEIPKVGHWTRDTKAGPMGWQTSLPPRTRVPVGFPAAPGGKALLQAVVAEV